MWFFCTRLWAGWTIIRGRVIRTRAFFTVFFRFVQALWFQKLVLPLFIVISLVLAISDLFWIQTQLFVLNLQLLFPLNFGSLHMILVYGKQRWLYSTFKSRILIWVTSYKLLFFFISLLLTTWWRRLICSDGRELAWVMFWLFILISLWRSFLFLGQVNLIPLYPICLNLFDCYWFKEVLICRKVLYNLQLSRFYIGEPSTTS